MTTNPTGLSIPRVKKEITKDVKNNRTSEVERLLCRYGLKGQRDSSPGQRPGYKRTGKLALKGQKPYLTNDAFALTGRWLRITFTQGAALDYELSGLSGHFCGACEI